MYRTYSISLSLCSDAPRRVNPGRRALQNWTNANAEDRNSKRIVCVAHWVSSCFVYLIVCVQLMMMSGKPETFHHLRFEAPLDPNPSYVLYTHKLGSLYMTPYLCLYLLRQDVDQGDPYFAWGVGKRKWDSKLCASVLRVFLETVQISIFVAALRECVECDCPVLNIWIRVETRRH